MQCRAREARGARRSQHTEKRRKMMDDLERRERQSTTEKSEEEQARARLKVRADTDKYAQLLPVRLSPGAAMSWMLCCAVMR
jgi:hypothetical protein